MEKRMAIGVLLVAVVCLAVAVQVTAQPSPFVISGWVNASGEPCDNACVEITNTNMSESWDAENHSDSNYYQLVLNGNEDVSAGNLLRFNVSGCEQSMTVEHRVTQSEMEDGGLFEFNIPPDTDWKQFHYDIANTGNSPAKAPDDNTTKWITDDIGAVEGSQAIIVGDWVFVYADTQVHALDRDTGVIIWSASIPGDTSGFGSWASPAYSNGKLFVSCGYNLSRINASDGTVEQMIAFPDGGHSCNGGPTVADGVVFASSGYGSPTAHYYAFDASDLTDVLWSFDVGSDVAGSTPAVGNDRVVFGNGTSLTRVNSTSGDLDWTTDLSSGTILGSAAIDTVNERVYVATGSGSRALLHALNFTDGSLIWTSYTAIDFTDGTPAILDREHVYISGNAYGSQGHTHCFNSTGIEQWRVPCGSWVMSPAVVDGKLYTGNCDDMGDWGMFEGIGVYDAMTGAPVWSYAYAGSSPSVSKGMVVSIGKGGKVYVFEEKEVFQFDTGKPVNPYPSISGTHYGKIIPDQNITVNKIYTYPCAGTGGHTEHAKIWNETIDECAVADWNGYPGDYHNLSFNTTLTLREGFVYSYIIETGSYPQIIHAPYKQVNGGNTTCTRFEDANGKGYEDWIPAFRLWYAA